MIGRVVEVTLIWDQFPFDCAEIGSCLQRFKLQIKVDFLSNLPYEFNFAYALYS